MTSGMPPRDADSGVGGRYTLFLATAGAFLAVLSTALLTPVTELLPRIVSDDALFYLVIARNGVAGHFSSFDGLETTNGYHPLWLLVCQGLAHLTSDPDGLVRLVFATGLLLYGASLTILTRLAWRLFGGGAWMIVPGAFVALVLPSSWYLTEAHLTLFLFSLCLTLLLDVPAADGGNGRLLRGSQLGGVAALLVLARLDMVFVVGPPLLWMALAPWVPAAVSGRSGGLSPDHRRGVEAQPLPLLIVGAVLAGYMSLNLIHFGMAMPISGALKGSFPRPVWPEITHILPFARGLPPLAAIFGVLAFRALGRRLPLEAEAERRILFMALGLVAFYLYEFLFQKDVGFGVFSWHFAGANLFLILLMAAPFRGARRTVTAGATAALLLLGGAGLYHKLWWADRPDDIRLVALRDAGLWIREHTPPDAIVAATDPGLVAYLGGRRTLSLDGLANNLHLQEAIREGRLADYLEERQVGWIVVLGRGVGAHQEGVDPFHLSLQARLYDDSWDTLLLPAHQEVGRWGGVAGLWRWSAGASPSAPELPQ